MESLICRICLDKSGTVSLFDKECDNIQYCTKLMRFVKIVVAEDDGLPGMLCDSCVSELTLSYQFVQKCEASDRALRCMSSPIDLYTDIETKVDLLHFKYDDVKDEYDDGKEDSVDGDLFIDCPTEISFDKDEIKADDTSDRKAKFRRKRVRDRKLGPIQCVVCGLMAASPSAMETHMRTHTGEKPYSCPLCESRFRTKGSLKRHNETYHLTRERKFTCEMCGSSFYRKSDIITHMRVHTDEKPFICMYCPKRFRQMASRNRHQKVHTGEKPYSCPICDKKFSEKNHVKKHQTVHSDERKYSCHLCNKSMKSRTALNNHMTLHTNEKQNVCSFCGMAFAMKGNLQTHIRRVHSERSGQCSVCLKTFSDLEAHMRKHTGEKPYACGKCNAAFAVKRSLTHHMMFKHENANKFKCSIGDCTKTFPTSTMLEFHLLKHTNHTPYICQHCSRGFFRTSDLSRHLRVSHMDVQVKNTVKSEMV